MQPKQHFQMMCFLQLAKIHSLTQFGFSKLLKFPNKYSKTNITSLQKSNFRYKSFFNFPGTLSVQVPWSDPKMTFDLTSAISQFLPWNWNWNSLNYTSYSLVKIGDDFWDAIPAWRFFNSKSVTSPCTHNTDKEIIYVTEKSFTC